MSRVSRLCESLLNYTNSGLLSHSSRTNECVSSSTELNRRKDDDATLRSDVSTGQNGSLSS